MIGSAVFATLTWILAKIGISNVESTLGTAIRSHLCIAIFLQIIFNIGTLFPAIQPCYTVFPIQTRTDDMYSAKTRRKIGVVYTARENYNRVRIRAILVKSKPVFLYFSVLTEW